MTGRPHRWSFHSYVGAVITAGALVVYLLAARGGLADVQRAPAAFWLLAVLFTVGEVRPIFILRRGQVEEFTTSTTFTVALLLGWGLGPAALVVLAGSIIADLLRRKALMRTLFNAAQYVLALAAASAVVELVGSGAEWQLSIRGLVALLLTGMAFFAANRILVRIVIALRQGAPLAPQILDPIGLAALPEALLVGMAPVAVILARQGAATALLLALPMIGVHLAYKAAADAHANRAVAEAAAEEARKIAAEKARLVEAEQEVVRRLLQSDQFKDNVLSTVSHELRTPLAGMLGAVQTLENREERLSDEQKRELVGMAVRQGERLKELIEHLLLAAQVQASGVPLPNRHPPVDAGELAREAVAAAKARYPRRVMELGVEDDLPVHAAPEAVLQAVSNLLDNAAKYAPSGAPVWVDAFHDGNLVVIAVEDGGPGVPAAKREWIFGRFGKLDGNVVRHADGVGLGLYIARRLARAEGGDLVMAEPTRTGAGARFELRVPPALKWEARSVADSVAEGIARETESRTSYS
ncbi:MAG TPA: ATP-binding protein [Actinomycetota bacterium]